MENFRKTQIQILIAILLIFLVGTSGYYFIEDGWTLFDSFYMVAITITTVGFGEIPHELSKTGRLFTVLLLFVGLGTAATFATHLARFIIEGELKGMFGRKKMQDKIKKTQGHYIVCGHGRTGVAICLKLYEKRIPFVVIDSDPEALDLAEHRGYLTVKGDATSDASLLAAGIERASGIVTCIPSDASAMSISLAARELNPKIHIIAQGTDPAIETRMARAGVDKVVYPLKLGGEQIARLIASQYGMAAETEAKEPEAGILGYHISVFRSFGADKITVKEAMAKASALQAIALKTEGGEIIEQPSPDLLVGKNDSLILLVRESKAAAATGLSYGAKEITWSDELSIGITEIDEQHRMLVLLAGEFEKGVAAGRGREQVAGVFDRLLNYTVEHFRNEESIMKRHNYPDTAGHIQKHRALTKQVMELNRDKKYVFPENVAEFLNSWLINHIMIVDKELGKFLKQQGVR